ncbi:MAG: permease-like cell division protein FtsX [Lachnospiraceae bacterium]|nr:permease-like cell division protein FtsX [Lachnospiraceae bacterium]
MKISSMGYCMKQGVKNIHRNRMFSFASIITIAACIFLFGAFFAVVMNFRFMFAELEKNLCVTVFFTEGISDEEITKLGENIRIRPEVDRLEYTSADEAWENYKAQYFEGYEAAADSFGDDNPLEGSSSYEIYLKDASKQEELVTFLKGLDGIRQVNYSASTANNLSDIAVLIGYVSITIIAILLGVSIFLISNTITIGVSVRKEEIAIMKLIGATDTFVRAPFIVEGIIIGLIGSAIPVAILYFAYDHVIEYIAARFTLFGSSSWFLSSYDIFRYLIPVALILGIGMGFIGSRITLRKHVKI